MNIVWFKRDLRLDDHQALVSASQSGPIIALYILEPALWKKPDMSARQFEFLGECIRDLQNQFKRLGGNLVIRVGDAISVLSDIYDDVGITALWSHQETWNDWTYQRDRAVGNWLAEKNISWHQPRQNGVIRCLENRDGWASQWYNFMKRPLAQLDRKLETHALSSAPWPKPSDIGLADDPCPGRQLGGRAEALKVLNSFFAGRGEGYMREMSSPVSAYQSCSRLSPYLAFGTLSIREVFQAIEKRGSELRTLAPAHRGTWLSALRALGGRLRWHCHFMQKLEDEPAIEKYPMHPAYIGIRENVFNEEYFQAWCEGETGYPMVDACMRALKATGWLNFRMRALLMSFASYHLWLDWREPGLYLARLFTDYEPGIHYSQVQMQSGTTGINAMRIYNPIKQGVDHDPSGHFIRTWVPELAHLSTDIIHTPWRAPMRANQYPLPIVDEKTARKAAADRLYALRKEPAHKAISKEVALKHGSRKSVSKKSRAVRSKKKLDTRQGELPL